MVRHMPYVQQWKGSYRFRRRVPDHLKPIIGEPEWVAALGTKDKAEANRLVVPHIGRTDQIIRDAERGDYPPLPNDRIEPIACDWWRWFCEERAKLLNVGPDFRAPLDHGKGAGFRSEIHDRGRPGTDTRCCREPEGETHTQISPSIEVRGRCNQNGVETDTCQEEAFT